MNYRLPIISHQSSLALLISILCWGTTASWAVGTADSRPTVPMSPGRAAVIDPCGPSAPSALTMQTQATAGTPAQNSTAALASLMARAHNLQNGVPSGSPGGGTPALDLWSSRISVPDAGEEAANSLALQRLILQVRTLTAGEKNPAPAPAAEPAQAPALPPVAAAAGTAEVEPTRAQPTAPAAPEAPSTLPAQAQKNLAEWKRDPARVRDPLGTAELLFLSGRPVDAVPFYEEALRRTDDHATACGADRAWMLFQLGNCLRETDMAKAQDVYAKLQAQYPDSPWTEMARASGQLLAWYQSAQLDQLMTTRKP